MNIAIASKNPVKINAIERAFKKAFPTTEFKIDALEAHSNVSDQPLGEEETLKGATNRLNSVKEKASNANYFASIEGGLIQENKNYLVFAWVLIESKEVLGKAKTAMFYLPETLAFHIREGKELGEADDLVFKRENSKQGDGTIGKLTNQLIDRTAYYEHAAILALAPHISRGIYSSKV